MCMSPHEMTSARIEEDITAIQGWVSRYPDQPMINMWKGRIEGLEGILKERADNGTYDTAGGDYS